MSERLTVSALIQSTFPGVDSVGQRLANVDAVEKACGKAQFASDVSLPRMCYARVLRSPLPHARIAGIDSRRALSLPGVKAVLTGKDCPQSRYGPAIADEHLLAVDKVRFAGDEVAIVIADHPEAVEAALELVEVSYEELSAVLDPQHAVHPEAALVHEDKVGNLALHLELHRGDVQQAFNEAHTVVEERFKTSLVYQAYMEPVAAVAEVDARGRVVLHTGLQDPSKARWDYAAALGMPANSLQLKQYQVGGGFGGKLQPKLPLLCALAAQRTGFTVKLLNSREEDFVACQARVPMDIRLKLGFTHEGRLVGKETEIVADNGAYTRQAPGILSTASYRVDALYRVAHVHVRSDLVYSNKMPTSAFRGFGNPQMHFAMETLLDIAADELNLDPVELRLRNFATPGYENPFGWRITSCGVEECLEKVVTASKWREKRRRARPGEGMGVACCVHVSGNRGAGPEYDGSSVMLTVGADGEVVIYSGEADTGQGARTVFTQIAADALGVETHVIRVSPIDTDLVPLAYGTYASRVTYLGGAAVKDAAEKAREHVLAFAAEELDLPLDSLALCHGSITSSHDPALTISLAALMKRYAYRHAGALITATGSFTPDVEFPDASKQGNISGAYPFAAQVAEVKVDRETGVVAVKKIWAAHDLGKAINPTLSEGQIEGGLVMGLGWALTEDLKCSQGPPANDQFLDYQIPTAVDTPEMQTFLVEPGEWTGPFGAKGLGEPTLVPTAPAIGNAIYHAIGVRLTTLPFTREAVLKAIISKDQIADTIGET